MSPARTSDDGRARLAGEDLAVSEAAPRCGSRGYEAWTKRDLYERAKELGVRHRHHMTKQQLIQALRRGRGASAGRESRGTERDLAS